MEGTKKWVMLGTLVMVVAVSARVGWIYHERREAEKPVETPVVHVTDDQMVWLKKKHQTSLKDARELNGQTVWISAGGQMTAYPSTPTHVDYAGKGALLLGAEPLHVVNMIEQVAPKEGDRIPKGDHQVVMLFTRPTDTKQLLGVPVGYVEEGIYKFYLDEIFFYDDPHTLYKHWPKEVWAAVDQHKVIKGMNELQSQIALGQVSKSAGTTYGNRTVKYYNDGHPVNVTYVHDAATEVVAK
ncbi:hypothetical protein [Terriglobus saanensis]|uniref:Uncharacterized protein n=1 Tax=Terriglobus saanensis (strain ATCC BAA-1853 / DSM 23119 / SP1PR4) TaxID=401053 RepID=E8V8Q2_TERSS|nr:hypothetical protein [Terriglobus saanensis]ADV84089.1 hypothetical protein AciPR4_3335 [Terriglobus saanensis SP1PR4]